MFPHRLAFWPLKSVIQTCGLPHTAPQVPKLSYKSVDPYTRMICCRLICALMSCGFEVSLLPARTSEKASFRRLTEATVTPWA